MGRIAVFLLVLIVAGLGARVLFVDAQTADESLPPPKPSRPPAWVAPTQPAPPSANPHTAIDPDPDLDQDNQPADCPGTPEPPVELEPELPAPH